MMIKYLLSAVTLIFTVNVLADNRSGETLSSVLCQPESPYRHNDNVIYENGRIKSLAYSYVACPIEINEDMRSDDSFISLQVYVRVNNTQSSGRVKCRLKNFDWRGQQELNTPWVETNGDGYANATLEIPADYVKRGGNTTMECAMPASTYIENFYTRPLYQIDPL